MIDKQYLEKLTAILYDGDLLPDRTDVGESVQKFWEEITYDANHYAPFIQFRSFSPKVSFLEWVWMMNGGVDSSWLEERGVTIWKPHTTREVLDSRGLQHLPEGSVGKSYGYQFRNFGGVDQIASLFDSLKNDPYSRRHVVSIWNVPELPEAPLNPCCFLYEFMVTENDRGDKVLNLHQHMRSADFVLGVPYNLSFGYFFLTAFAAALGYIPGQHKLTMTNAHVYKNHVDKSEQFVKMFKQYSLRSPYVKYNKPMRTLDDILSLQWEDLSVHNWKKGDVVPGLTVAV